MAFLTEKNTFLTINNTQPVRNSDRLCVYVETTFVLFF